MENYCAADCAPLPLFSSPPPLVLPLFSPQSPITDSVNIILSVRPCVVEFDTAYSVCDTTDEVALCLRVCYAVCRPVVGLSIFVRLYIYVVGGGAGVVVIVGGFYLK